MLLLLYTCLGITILGFNRSPLQIILTVTSACLLDVVLYYLFRKPKVLIPLSSAISGLSLAILLNYGHGLLLSFTAVIFTVCSKYIFTFKDKHIFNPSLFGVVACLLFSRGLISPSPAYQWSGYVSVAAFIVTCATLLFVFRIKRSVLIASFLCFYILQLGFRAWLTRYHVPPETLFLGMLSSPAFYLFAFFMITDPKTSPDSRWGQITMAFTITVLDLVLHKLQALSTFFYAGFVFYSLRLLYLHIDNFRRGGGKFSFRTLTKRMTALFLMSSLVGLNFFVITPRVKEQNLGFKLVEVRDTGIDARQGDVLAKIDPQISVVGKWLLSVGDAASAADVDNDGLVDLFLTLPLKKDEDRAGLYLNRGGFKFERFEIAALEGVVFEPEKKGLISFALFADFDNDGDQDIFFSVAWGESIYLRNTLIESGSLGFVDISEEIKVDDYGVSISSNAADFNRDGRLDLIVPNAMQRYLPGYNPPVRFNIFDLPQPEYEDDRRMLNVMHRTWHNASNGDTNYLYLNRGNSFEKLESEEIGLTGTRWSLDVAAGDLNGDGFPDLYIANDFGPDDLLINKSGKSFERLEGKFVGQLGRDTYKGMNASMGDVDNNGHLDIYVSNVHEKLQAEGSLLWFNDGRSDSKGHRSFSDVATERSALNENRFGWGAAMGDLDRDGRLDILQANGHVDDNYDKLHDECPDFWYWNAQIGLTSPDIHGYADKWADITGKCIFPEEKNRVYLNRDSHFVDVAEQVGWEKPGTARGISLADFDNDGDLDVVLTRMFAPPELYRNDSEPRGWVGLDLVGDGKRCNRDAVGTRVVISYTEDGEEKRQNRTVFASNGLSSQNDRRLLFGLGDYQGEVRADIYWCGDEQASAVLLEINSYKQFFQ